MWEGALCKISGNVSPKNSYTEALYIADKNRILPTWPPLCPHAYCLKPSLWESQANLGARVIAQW
jgi:hypothetical protein